MKKKIPTFLFFGVIFMISMGFRSQPAGEDFSGGSAIRIIKGEVINSDKDKYWESLTFGLVGLNKEYSISAIEFLDKKGRSIGWVDDLTELRIMRRGISWYSIDLNGFKIKHEFTMVVHIMSNASGVIDFLSALAATSNSGGSPIDPDETILIVKYP
jgi:hypothetical protein